MKTRFCIVLAGILFALSACSRDPNVVKLKYVRSGDDYAKAGIQEVVP